MSAGDGRLEGKVAVVTGASRGVGLAVADVLAREGAQVVATDVLALDAAVAAVSARGGRALAVRADVTSEQDVKALFDAAAAEHGGVDVLACCAGVYGGGDLGSAGVEEFARVLDVNLLGTYLCLREAFPHLRARGGGKIVCIGSVAGRTGGYLCGPHYAASKGGVHALCRWAAKHGAPDVHVNVVAPGAIATDMIKGEPYPRDISLLRRQGTPEEVAEAVLFLAGSASDYVTGTVLEVDGGL